MNLQPVDLESVSRLHKDLKAGAADLTQAGARFLVDDYYAMQDFRIQCGGQVRAAEAAGEPHAVNLWLQDQMKTLEREVSKVLGVYAESKREGRWALSQHGIGPVLTAGLLAHIDIHKAPTAGHIWRFAGLDPTVRWEKGCKRPWNAKLKLLCWKIGDSFKKTSGSPKSYYGALYQQRKALEVERNAAGQFAEQAQDSIGRIKDPATLATYKQGQLPAGRLDLRAMRWATKMFLSHYHHVAYQVAFDRLPPKPFVIEHLGHVHVIEPPGWPCE